MYVIPVAYYVVKPDGGLQQSGPRIEVVGNTATLRQQPNNYYFDQQSNMAQQKYPYYSNNPQYAVPQMVHPGYNQQNWGSYPQQQAYYPQQQYNMYQQHQGSYYQPPTNTVNNNNYAPIKPGGDMVVPVPPRHPAQQSHSGQNQQQQQFFPPTNAAECFTPAQQQQTGHLPTPPGSRPNSLPGSRSNSLERRRQRTPTAGGMQIEIPTDAGVQGPLSAGSLPPSYAPSPRHREFREAMEQPVCPRTPPPRQLFELPYNPKKDPPPPQNVRHVRPQDLVPPEVIQMYAGRPPEQRLEQFEPTQQANGGSSQQPNFSRSSSLRRSQGPYADEAKVRRAQQQQINADLVKTHLNLSASREHLGPSSRQPPKQQRPTQHYAEPITGQTSLGQETAHLVRHIPPDEAARLPQELFEEKPKWQPLRPDKFSIFGKEAAYPPFPVIGPRYMISVSGAAKLIEILLSIIIIILVTVICDRGRCFPRMYIPMATEVVMWIVAGCAVLGTFFICIPYARKKPLSPKAYYRFLLVEVGLTILGAFSYFVASICLLVIKEGEIIGYLIETWVCAAALGLVCGILYVCSAVFAWLALQRAKYYLEFLRYASARHREDPNSMSYRMSVHPNPVPQQQQQQFGNRNSVKQNAVYNRPSTTSTASRYN